MEQETDLQLSAAEDLAAAGESIVVVGGEQGGGGVVVVGGFGGLPPPAQPPPGDNNAPKLSATVFPLPFSDQPHSAWTIGDQIPNEDDEDLPRLPQGPIVGPIVPSQETSLQLNDPTADAQQPVRFRTFTKTELAGGWPPDMSGAKAGDVVLMSGNLWLKLSVDGGQTFTDLDWTKIFASDTTYGGWAGDQVIHYVPDIDCFVLYVQSFKGSGTNASKNVVKVALASPADLKTYSGGKKAWWRQWDFTSDTFGLGSQWLDFPDLTYGIGYLYITTNVFNGASFAGKLFFELPLNGLEAGAFINFLYAFIADANVIWGSPTQNIGDENYWPAHVDNSKMHIYSSKGTDSIYHWRERTLSYNWPRKSDNDIVSAAPDFPDWISEDHRIIGATRVGTQLWFAWTANSGDGGQGGFSFPQPHIEIAKFDLSQNYKLIEQLQIWNSSNAYAYPSLTTNGQNEVAISLAWGGAKKYYGSHAVGLIGDFVVWYGEESEMTSERQKQDAAGYPVTNPDGTPVMISRWGDYVHVRRADPDSTYFSAFGYAVLTDRRIRIL